MPWLPRWWQVQVLVLVPMTRTPALPMPVVPLPLCGMVDMAPMHPRLQHPHQGDWMCPKAHPLASPPRGRCWQQQRWTLPHPMPAPCRPHEAGFGPRCRAPPPPRCAKWHPGAVQRCLPAPWWPCTARDQRGPSRPKGPGASRRAAWWVTDVGPWEDQIPAPRAPSHGVSRWRRDLRFKWRQGGLWCRAGIPFPRGTPLTKAAHEACLQPLAGPVSASQPCQVVQVQVQAQVQAQVQVEVEVQVVDQRPTALPPPPAP